MASGHDNQAWRNVPAQSPVKSSAGVCGMHGAFVGPFCPKCVTQPKVLPRG